MNNEEFIKKMVQDVWNNHNIEAIQNFYDQNVSTHGPHGDIKGIKEYQNFVKSLFQAFPDLNYKIQDCVVSNNKVVIRWTGTGTHKGNFIGNAPTNKKINYDGMTIFHLQNNKIKEVWVNSDLFGVLKQLGLIHAGSH